MEAPVATIVRPSRRSARWQQPVWVHPDARLKPVYMLGERCRYEAGHAHQVTRLALRLFDELSDLHEGSATHRFHLTAAALLHDIGYLDGRTGHHKTSLRYILESPVLPWDERRRLIVGNIARYHRKALPGPTHEHFAALDEDDQRDVRLLGGMLRLADALDRGHRSVVRDLICETGSRRITLHCVVSRSAEAQARAAMSKSDLLCGALERDVEIRWQRM